MPNKPMLESHLIGIAQKNTETTLLTHISGFVLTTAGQLHTLETILISNATNGSAESALTPMEVANAVDLVFETTTPIIYFSLID